MLHLLLLFLHAFLFNVDSAGIARSYAAIKQSSAGDSIPQANMFIHLDKEMYDPGETIWFKAYLFADFMPATVESEFRIKLFDAKGNTVAAKNYPVVDATALGDIDLPDTLLRGIYHLMANSSSTIERKKCIQKNGEGWYHGME